MTWTPPWKPGLPQARCVACHVECVEQTLLVDGRCVMCAKDDRSAPPPAPAPDPQQALFDAPARQPDFDELVR